MNGVQATVLVVDDNETNRDVLSRRLERYDHLPLVAENGRAALHILQEREVDLILLDLMMPEMNGYQLLERIKEDPDMRHTPVIVISALDDIDSIVKCIQLGAEDYLTKPFNPLILKARIMASLEKKQLRDQEQEYIEEIAMMQRVVRELNDKLNMQRATEITLEWGMRRSEANAGVIGVLDGEDFVPTAVTSAEEELTHLLDTPYPISKPMQRAIRSGLPQAGEEQADFLIPSSRSQVIIPITRAGQTLGLLILDAPTAQRHANKTLAFLTRLSDHAALAIANAKLYEAVQQANVAKSEFISEVSHELKNPMTSIYNYAKMLASMGEINADQAAFIDTITHNVRRMEQLVSDLSDVSRIESGHLRLELGDVALPSILDISLNGLRGRIAAKAQTLRLDLPADLPLVYADPHRVQQILVNLISNAHKYTPEGGTIEISVGVINAADQPMLQISVADNGLGIRAEDQDKIFNKYFRASDAEAQLSPGTGLGLNITKNLVEIQGGQIWFESAFRDGTTFYLTLPLAEDPPSPVLSEEETEPAASV